MMIFNSIPNDAATNVIESRTPLPMTSDDAVPSDDSTRTTTTITTEDSESTSSSSSSIQEEYATSTSPRRTTKNQQLDGGGVWLPPSMRYNPGTKIFSIRQPQDLLDFVIEDERLSVGESFSSSLVVPFVFQSFWAASSVLPMLYMHVSLFSRRAPSRVDDGENV